jgi:hypothetical protein
MNHQFRNQFRRREFKFTAAGFAAAIPCGALFLYLHFELGLSQPWVSYLSGFLFYSIFVFGYAWIDDRSTLFSQTDSRSKTRLFVVHLNYLVGLLLVIQAANFLEPYLPASILARRVNGWSWFEFIRFTVLGVVFFVEESWLAAKRDSGRTGSKEAAVAKHPS